MSFPLPASIEFSSSDEDEAVSAKAPVCIVVHEAKCLPTVQWIGRQDPYAIATSLPTMRSMRRTKYAPSGDTHPKWSLESLTCLEAARR